LIARTEERLWQLDRDPPALLVPGTRVRFVDG
jgi:allophanate hydrolase subunit 1